MKTTKTAARAPKSLRLLASKNNERLAKSALALAITLVSTTSLAQESDDEEISLDTIEVKDRTIDTNPYAEDGAPYKAKKSGDERRVKDLADTPQTISVITRTQIEEAGDSDLKEVLDAQPGVTIGTGENGNAFGDRYIIRGYEARSDVFVDGMRDPGMTTRESFATEQVEITKGPSSTFAGRGTTGGAVNSITKQASTDYDFTKFDVGVGTDQYERVTVDTNQKISEEVALRANLLHAYEEVPDRGPADRERVGGLLSGAFSPNDKLKMLADYYYLKADDTPDLGTYIRSLADGGKPVDDIPVYLQQDRDFLETEVESLTFRVNYDFQDNLRLSNASRVGTTDNGYITSGVRGTVRGTNDIAPGVRTMTLSTHNGWQEVGYFGNQTNVYLDLDFGDIKHQFVFGGEYVQEDVLNGIYRIDSNATRNCITGTSATTANAHCIVDENGSLLSGINELMDSKVRKGTEDSDYHIDTVALYAMDTITFDPHWSTFFGVRYDYFDYKNVITNTTTKDTTRYQYSDGFWGGHAGVVYNVNEQGNIYLSYGMSSDINGGESDVGGSCGYGGLCGTTDLVEDGKPEKSQNVELGTKWNLLDEKLLLSAAIFELRKNGVMESAPGNDYSNVGSVNTGKNRVQGIEFSLVGNITDELSAQFGAAFMDAKVVKTNVPANDGLTLSNFADNSAFLQLRYQATPKFAFGGGVTYSSEQHPGQPDTAAGYNTALEEYSFTVPDYTTYDLFASYKVTEQMNLRLNINNVTDENYYLAAYRSGSFTYLGDGRNARLTLSYSF